MPVVGCRSEIACGGRISRYHWLVRIFCIGLIAFVAALPTPACAADALIGHRSSVSKYASPAEARSLKLVAKAGRDGNTAAFPMPVLAPFTTPAATTSYVLVRRDGGTMFDPLIAGDWQGYGDPKGSKGWRYTNRDAPYGGAVKLLLIKGRSVKLVTSGTGSMPAPTAANGPIEFVLQLGDQRYCAAAQPPHAQEHADRLIASRAQPPAAGCAIECASGDDSDGDRLIDCVETNTHAFVDAGNTGTDPFDADTDDDGIPDGDEVVGTTTGLDLPTLGVHPLRRDILVEYDWFDDELDCGPHSHRPTPGTLALLETMFATAPVSNPDGSTGIHLIQDVGQGGALSGGSRVDDADGIVSSYPGEERNHKYANFPFERGGYFHYALLPHLVSSGASGQAEVLGDDMTAATDACGGTELGIAILIAHELGHNLGLLHGGGDGCNNKPNYNSIMNYLYAGGADADCTPPGDGVLTYSYGDRPPLDENALDEHLGICGTPPWDWNGDGIIESGVSLDINAVALQSPCGGELTVLEDFDDWAHLDLSGPSREYVLPGLRAGSREVYCTLPIVE